MARAPDAASPSRADGRRLPRRLIAGAAGIAALGLLGAFAQEVASRARLVAPHPSVMLHDRHGAFLAQIGGDSFGQRKGAPRGDYGYWPLERLPDRVVRATLALEDRRFFAHPGVDPLAMLRASWFNLRGRQRSGASTIA